MILPKNGRIAVIDDKTEEHALPLLKALFKEGFSAVYFSGESSELPIVQLKDIRVVFLDMELVPGPNDQSKAAATARILSQIIDVTTTRFYFLIIWATHNELLEPFWRYIKEGTDYKCSFLTVYLDKGACKANGYDISFIKQEIENKIKENDGYTFLINWENMINKSTNNVTNDFLSLFEDDEGDVNRKLLGAIKLLAVAYSGKVLETGDDLQIEKDAMLAFNSTLKDSVERNVANISEGDICFDSSDDDIESSAIAGINSKLLLCETDANPKPGNIYEVDNAPLLKKLLKEVAERNHNQIEQDQACKVVFCEISPLCDYAQQKWACYRFIYGITVPAKHEKHIKNAPFIFRTPILKLNENDVFITLNLRRIETMSLDKEIQLDYLCTMRKDLISAIQHSFSNHCSRPGLVSL